MPHFPCTPTNVLFYFGPVCEWFTKLGIVVWTDSDKKVRSYLFRHVNI